jgi:adenine phosphoribosyltransferase
MTLREQVLAQFIDIPNFPKEGILFKDILPLFQNPEIVKKVSQVLADNIRGLNPTALVGIESRGFLLGPLLAQELQVPFVCIRKKGKLPGKTIGLSYELEYGHAEIEMQIGSITADDRVIVHDDVLATGGTAIAAEALINKTGAQVIGHVFLLDIKSLGGKKKIENENQTVHTFVTV